MNETELLRRYAEEGSQEAFAELVRLRIGLVYSAALRQTGGDVHGAEDVTQAVFTVLTRNAAARCHELRSRDESKTSRIFHRLSVDAVVVLDVNNKTTQKTPQAVLKTVNAD